MEQLQVGELAVVCRTPLHPGSCSCLSPFPFFQVAAAETHLREAVDLVLRCLELTFIDVARGPHICAELCLGGAELLQTSQAPPTVPLPSRKAGGKPPQHSILRRASVGYAHVCTCFYLYVHEENLAWRKLSIRLRLLMCRLTTRDKFSPNFTPTKAREAGLIFV